LSLEWVEEIGSYTRPRTTRWHLATSWNWQH